MTRILLDAGHGGGNSSRRGFVTVKDYIYCNEGQNNFYFSGLLKQELEKKGFFVGLTRNNMGDDPSLPARGAKADGYDLMISVHSNANDGNAHGAEVWDSTNSVESDAKLGRLLSKTTADTLGIPDRGVKYKKNNSGSNWYGILRNGKAAKNMILEMFFHDNYNDTVKYINNHKQLAVNLATALAKHYKLEVDKPEEQELTLEQSKFIGEVLSYILVTKRRILPSVSLAQAILESNWGRSELAKNAKNLFGIKAAKDWQGLTYPVYTKEQDKAGNESTIKADFRKYESWQESVIDHDDFFVIPAWREKYYSKVLNAKNWEEQCNALTGTYATDIQYAEKLKDIIRKYKLYKYDDEVVQVEDKNKPSGWAAKDWQEAIDKGITDGTRPKDNVTREEAIAMILRAIRG